MSVEDNYVTKIIKSTEKEYERSEKEGQRLKAKLFGGFKIISGEVQRVIDAFTLKPGYVYNEKDKTYTRLYPIRLNLIERVVDGFQSRIPLLSGT